MDGHLGNVYIRPVVILHVPCLLIVIESRGFFVNV